MSASAPAREGGQRLLFSRWALVLAAAPVVCLYLSFGISRSLWLDEANTVLISRGPLDHIFSSLWLDVSPPAYYMFLSGWMRIFGDSEIALRLPSILFYLAGIAVMWRLGDTLLGKAGGRAAAFLYAVNPVAGRQAQNVRMYSMLALLVALSFLVLLTMTRDPGRRNLKFFALFGLIAFVGLNTHYWFAFVLVGYGAWLLLTRSWVARELAILGAFTVAPFAAMDLAMFLQQSRVPATLWTPRPGLGTLAKAVAGNFGLLPLRSPRAIGMALALALAVLAPLASRRRQRAPSLARVRQSAFLYGVCLLVPFLVSFGKPIFVPGRYDIIAVPFFVLVATAALLYIPARPRLLVQLVIAASCGACFVYAVRASADMRQTGALDLTPVSDRAAARAICRDAAAGDYVVFTGLSRAAVDFYLQRFGCAGRLKRISYPAEFENHMGWEDPRRNYAGEPTTAREAESIASAAHSAGARVFLLYQPDQRLSGGIVHAIESRFRRASSTPFSSCEPCFREVRLYVPQ